MHTLADIGPTKLLAGEQDLVRETADALFFCEAATDEAAIEALENALSTLEQLVESGRWTEERASELAHDLEACGPGALVG